MIPVDPRLLVGVVETETTELVMLRPRRAVRRWRLWLAERLIRAAARLAGIRVSYRV